MQRSRTSTLLSWGFFVVGTLVVVPSLLFLGKNGLGFSLADVLDKLVRDWNEWLRDNIGILVEPYIEDLFRWLRETFGLPLHLQSHWQHVFIVMWLFLSAYGKAGAGSVVDALFDRTTWWRLGTALVVAFLSALAAGTVALTALGVLYWPVAGFYVFLALNEAGGRPAVYLRRALSWGLTGLAFAWLVPAGFPLFSGWAPSAALLGLVGLVLVFAIYLLFVGLPGHQAEGDEHDWLSQRRSNPGTRIALLILTPMALAVLATWQGHRLPQPQPVREAQRVFPDGSFQDCEACPRMVRVPAGSFVMGSDQSGIEAGKRLGAPNDWLARETPARRVQVPGFALGMTEVTRGQFAQFVKETQHEAEGFCAGLEEKSVNWGSGRNWRNPGFAQDDDHPVVCVTHWDAIKYTQWLSRKTGHVYRLPTEAEWEYAARAGSLGSRHWGEANADACTYANVFDQTAAQRLGFDARNEAITFPCSDGYPFTAPVGRFKPNAFGLHDMMGNAWEWTLDCFRDNYAGAPPTVSLDYATSCGGLTPSEVAGSRVIRGGGWLNYPWRVRSADRNRYLANSRYLNSGFRVSRTD